jgi:hypothetical protein
MTEILATTIDRAITLEMRPTGIPRGVMPGLYEAVRRRCPAPLTLLAAQRLQALPAGARVFLATGAGAPEVLPQGETDGPLGVAALARMVRLGLGGEPVVLTTAGYEAPIRAALAAYDTPADILSLAASATGEQARAVAEQWLEAYQPDLAIAVEMKGAARDGQLHFMTARVCACDARLDQVFLAATQRGITTIGVGDGGNEIGFGAFQEAVVDSHPHGAAIACTIATDILVVAAMSNWGCYGIEAVLAGLLGHPEWIHSGDMGVRAMQACAAAGAGDGIYTKALPLEDGLSADVHRALMTLLSETVRIGLTDVHHALALDERH